MKDGQVQANLSHEYMHVHTPIMTVMTEEKYINLLAVVTAYLQCTDKDK